MCKRKKKNRSKKNPKHKNLTLTQANRRRCRRWRIRLSHLHRWRIRTSHCHRQWIRACRRSLHMPLPCRLPLDPRRGARGEPPPASRSSPSPHSHGGGPRGQLPSLQSTDPPPSPPDLAIAVLVTLVAPEGDAVGSTAHSRRTRSRSRVRRLLRS